MSVFLSKLTPKNFVSSTTGIGVPSKLYYLHFAEVGVHLYAYFSSDIILKSHQHIKNNQQLDLCSSQCR